MSTKAQREHWRKQLKNKDPNPYVDIACTERISQGRLALRILDELDDAEDMVARLRIALSQAIRPPIEQ